ncbi:MAG: tRNA adenosine(34) deaminase TadA [Buchnera aphidicola (Chaetogeoica yunlongensis)]
MKKILSSYNFNDEYFMKYAIYLAKLAEIGGDVPVGSVLVLDNTIIGTGINSSILNSDPTAHAEILALRKGAKYLKNYRLLNSTLYVTLEPCCMCYGAIFHSRISRLVFGTRYKNSKKYMMCCKNYIVYKNFFKNFSVTREILKKECSYLLNNFFKKKRK